MASSGKRLGTSSSAASGHGWKNSIVGYGEEAPEQFLAHPLNAFKIHPLFQQQAMEGALDDLGWLAPVVVSKRSGYLLDGHLRVAIAISRNEPLVPVAYVDIPEAKEAEALATFDPIGALIAYDKEPLDALLREVQAEDSRVQGMLKELAEREGLTRPSWEPEPDKSVCICPVCGHKHA